jgi:hypothetical protein
MLSIKRLNKRGAAAAMAEAGSKGFSFGEGVGGTDDTGESKNISNRRINR